MRLLPALALVFGGLLLADVFYATAAPPQQQVEVTNFPNPQNVTGSVEITNLPNVQDVSVVNEPLLVTGEPPPRFQLVGFATATRLGDAGVLVFTLACQEEFLGSRMCSSIEVLETVDVPSLAGSFAWVRPTLMPGGGTSNTHNDASTNIHIYLLVQCRSGARTAFQCIKPRLLVAPPRSINAT